LPKKEEPHLAIAKKPVVKGEGVRQYLVALPPDIWVVEGANGTAFSLGSLKFEVKPGEVIDLGVLKPAIDYPPGENAKSVGGAMLGAMFFGSLRSKNLRPVRMDWHARAATDLPVPAILAGRQVQPAAFEPGAKFGNYLGGLVNRIGGRAARFKELAAEQGTLTEAAAGEQGGADSSAQ